MATSSSSKLSYPYWHVYTDKDGVSKQVQCTFTDFELQSVNPPAAPEWLGKKYGNLSEFLIIVQPVGWVGTWHENPQPQWIIALSGTWFVETMDGTRVEYPPGSLCLGMDQGTVEKDGKKGHLSGTVGNQPSVVMQVRFKEDEPALPRCFFK